MTCVNGKRVFLVKPHVPAGYLDIVGKREDIRIDRLEHDTPPDQAVRLREFDYEFAHAAMLAPKHGAGTLVYVGRFDVAEFAVVLEPTEPLIGARRVFYAAMGALADGDTNAEIPFAARHDEIGRMATAVVVFKDNMVKARALEAEAAAVKETNERQRRADMQRLADQCHAAVGGQRWTVQAKLADPAAAVVSAAVTVTVEVPVLVGVPVMRPVEELMASPRGSPVAV